MKILRNSTIKLMVIKKTILFVSVIYAWVNSVQLKEKYEEMKTRNVAFHRASGHFSEI